jgi:multiple sugar transport system permease protein
MVWRWIFHSQYGIINTATGANVNWLTNPATVLLACALVAIWSSVGYDTVLLLSGLQGIPKSYYEAAEIDGSSKIKQFFDITLPMLSPTTFFVVIMRVMASLKIYDLIYMMIEPTNPALPRAQSLMYLFYRESFVVGNKGYGAVIAIWTVALIAVVTFIQFKGQKKWVNYDV